MLDNSLTYEIEQPTAQAVDIRHQNHAHPIAIWILISLMGLVVVVRAAMALYAANGGGDFYYYIVIAREWLRLPAGELPLSQSWLFYNPGIFRFYQALMLCGVTTAQGLAIAINSFNVVSAFLVTIILWRMKIYPILSIWAGIWLLFTSLHFDAFGGQTEPLVVFPMLFSLAIVANPDRVWCRNRSLLIVGAGLALSIHAKQQGSLYAFGAFWTIIWISNWRQTTWMKQASVLSTLVAGIVLLLLAAEPGTLMEVLLTKIRAVLIYPAQNPSMWSSLGGDRAADPKLGYLLVLLAIVLFGLRFFKEGKSWLATPAGALFALCVMMALSTAWQVHSRHYRQYLLLTWPAVIIAVAIGVHYILESLSSLNVRRWRSWVLLLIIVFPFTKFDSHRGPWFTPEPVGISIIDAYLETWGMTPMEPWFFPKPTILPIIGARLRNYTPPTEVVQDAMPILREELPERTKVIVMPSIYNVVYWNLNLRHPVDDYGFAKDDSVRVEALQSEEAYAVIFVTNHPKYHPEWLEQAVAARFEEIRRMGPVVLMRRQR